MMNQTQTWTAAEQEQLRRLEHALQLITVPFPHFTGLVRAVRIVLDRRVPTMGVFASGRLVANPQFVRGLKENELGFVLAHELFHLALRSHERAVGSDWLQFNHAHDYIINDILRVELQFPTIPAGGLDWPGARLMSAEEILLQMKQNPDSRPSRSVWQRPGGAGGQPGESDEEGEGQPGSQSPQGDLLDSQLEREWFPGEDPAELQAQADALKEEAAKALSLGKAMNAMKGLGRGTDAGAANQLVDALRGLYRTPWEMMLQRWLESVAPGMRTFFRASRRSGDRKDIVLPGRKREGWILNIILDTSGSMTEEIPRALGTIADFCDAVAVDQLRLIQCDTAVTSDKFLMPSEVAKHEVSGYGGSDLTPAMRYLADDSRVEAVVILTDGDITYSPEAMPYDLLWVLPPHGSPAFRPPYGLVINMNPS